MTTAQVVETSVTVNDNSPIQDYVNPDDQTQPTFEMTPGFKPFTRRILTGILSKNSELKPNLSSINIRESGVLDRYDPRINTSKIQDC